MRRLDIFQEKNDTHLFVASNNALSQSFISSKDNLAGVRFPVYNPRLGGKEVYLVTISDENHNLLRKETFSESNLAWGGDLRYDFAPIALSENRQFFLTVSFIGENKEDGSIILSINQEKSGMAFEKSKEKKLGDLDKKYITLLYTKNDNYSGGAGFLNSDRLPGDLVFSTYNQVDLRSYIPILTNDIVQRIRQDKISLFGYCFLMLFILVVVLYRVKIHKK